MDFFARGLVSGSTEIFPLNELANVYERLRKGDVSKHLVLDLQDCE
jgi:D-arabinose 1-dehydrogenase-like Zn-dependent alcohol dehydrogenase